jgi:arylsulfatase A-like enzyme
MAQEGIRFTDFYIPATVCTPSRAALLTGCYPKRVGLHEAVLFPYSKHGLNPSEQILPEILKTYGYKTACIGKWHLGHYPQFMPNRQGFDYFFGVPYSNDMDGYLYRNPPYQSPPLPLYENENLIEEGPDQNFLTSRYTNAAVNFIRENQKSNFFLYLAHNMPHLPLHVSDDFRGSSNRDLYGDVIQEIDWGVGQILSTLKELKIDRKTLLFFTSDNGPVLRENAGSAGPLRGGKATTWEGGQRVPFIVYGPGHIPGNRICREISTSMDLLPTIVNMTGGKLEDNVQRDGYDISSLLLNPGSENSPYDAFYYYSRDGEPEAIREGRWKLHIKKSRGWKKDQGPFPVSLYDLKSDIGEKHNLAANFPELTARLTKKIERFDSQLSLEIRPVAQIEK